MSMNPLRVSDPIPSPSRLAATGLGVALLLGTAAVSAPALADDSETETRDADVSETDSAALSGGGSKGLGVALGSLNTSVTGKWYTSDETALQLFVGTWLYGSAFGPTFAASADFVWEFANLTENDVGRLFTGAGVGGGVAQWFGSDYSRLVPFVNGVVELGWHFEDVPVELIFDWRPTFMIGGCGQFDGVVGPCLTLPQFSLAGRWYF